MRLLIIGASGFLGSHIRRGALDRGMEVVTAGRSGLPGSADHRLLDLAADEPDYIEATITSAAPDVLVNCAGATAGELDVLSAANITGMRALAAAMLATPGRPRLVHLGSAAEYGPGVPGTPLRESAPPRPVSAYGVTKLAGTSLVELARAAGLDAVVLRVFNPVGPGAPESSLPGRVAAELRRAGCQDSGAGPAEIRLGALDGVRDFVDARDVADAVLAAALAADLPRPVLNIGSGLGVPIRALVAELIAASGVKITVIEDASGSARSAAASWQEADIAAARRDLGWQPERALATALADLWRENP